MLNGEDVAGFTAGSASVRKFCIYHGMAYTYRYVASVVHKRFGNEAAVAITHVALSGQT